MKEVKKELRRNCTIDPWNLSFSVISFSSFKQTLLVLQVLKINYTSSFVNWYVSGIVYVVDGIMTWQFFLRDMLTKASIGLKTTTSVPVCLSSIPFWDVPKYCSVSKNKNY